MYGKVWDIKFYPLKSEVFNFGGQQPNAIEITMEDSIIPWGGRVKYLACYFSVHQVRLTSHSQSVNCMVHSTAS